MSLILVTMDAMIEEVARVFLAFNTTIRKKKILYLCFDFIRDFKKSCKLLSYSDNMK